MKSEMFVRDIQGINKQIGREAFSPCYEVFFCCTGERSAYRAAILLGLDEISRRFEQPLKWYKTNTMKWPRKLRATAQETARDFIDSIMVKPPRLAGIQFHSGTTNEEYMVPSLAFFSSIVPVGPTDTRKSRTYLRLCIPSSSENAPELIRELCHLMLSSCPIYSGHCGWSFYWSIVDSEEEKLLEAKAGGWLERFPGLFYGDPLSFLEFIGDGILTVSWLTYLSREAAESHGESIESVIERVKAKGIQSELIGQVLEAQATRKPELGDRSRNDLLPGYINVGRELAFAGLTREQALYLPILGLEREERPEWYQRFLE